MDNVNNQPITNISPAPQSPQPVESAEPEAGKRFLFYGVLLGLVILFVVIGGVLLLSSPKKMTNSSMVSMPSPTAQAEVQAQNPTVNSASELDSLLTGLTQTDNSLDTQLTSLEKDSSF